MRLEIPLIMIVIALIVLGGFAIDEYYVRNDLIALQAEFQQTQDALQNANAQVTQLKGQLEAYQVQVTQCTIDKDVLSRRIVELESENQALRNENQLLKTTSSIMKQPIVGSSIAGFLGLTSIIGGMWTAKKLKLYRKSASHQPSQVDGSTYVRLSDQECRELISRRRKQN